MLRRSLHITVLMLLVILLGSCGDDSQEGPLGPTVQVITVSPNSVSVATGATATFSAVGGTGTYSWESSQPQIGTVSTGGVFTPLQPGETTIICTDTQGLRGTATAAVSKNLITVSPSQATVDYASTTTFTATGGTSSSYFWWVEPPSIYGTITQSGVFTAKNVDGTVTVSATDDAGNVGYAQMTIRGVSLNISPMAVTVNVGNTLTFTASGGTESFTWASSDTGVGTITTPGSSVTFTAVAAGTTTITVTDSDGATAMATVTVSAAGSGSLIIVPGSVSLQKGATYQFSAFGGSATYLWSISDPAVGSINTSGLFTASSTAGTATITVTDSLNATNTASVTIVNSTVTVSPSTATVSSGTSLTFVGTGGAGTYWWSSGDINVFTVPTQTAATSSTTVTATGAGTNVLLTAIDDNGNTGTASITVTGPAAVTITPNTATFAVGSTLTFVGTGGAGTYWWSSGDINIATVPSQTSTNSSTILTAVSPGTIILSAIDDNASTGMSGTITITGTSASPVTISPSAATLTATSTLTAVGTGGLGTYLWSSNNGTVATVSTITASATTMITAVAAGTATIYAIDTNGNTGTLTITVP